MYIKLFNECLKEFFEELKEVFPEFKQKIDDIYIFDNIEKNNKYLKFFYKNAKKYSDLISTKNEMLFSEGIVLLKGIDFNFIWNSNISQTTKESIWKYLQLLYSRAHICLNEAGSKKTAKDVINKNVDYNKLTDEEKAFASILDKINFDNIDVDEDNEGVGNDGNELLSNLFGGLGENFMAENFAEELMGTEIGKLAEEIAGDINPTDININDLLSEITGNNGNPENFNNLIGNITNKVVSKLQNSDVNEDKITTEANNIINKLSSNKNLNNLDVSGMLGGDDNNPQIDFSSILNMFSKKDLNNISKFSKVIETQNDTPVKNRLKKKLEKKIAYKEKTPDEILDQALKEI